MEYSLKIFVKTKNTAKIEKITNIGWGIFIIVCFLLDYFSSHIHNYLVDFIIVIMMLFIVCVLVMVISSHFRDEELLGYFDGEIIFKKDLINVKGQEINLDEIAKIEIYNDDYKGKSLYKGRYNVDGCLSQGVGNLLFVKMKSGKEVEVNFLQTKKNQIREMEPLLIHYCQKGIIHRLHFMSILGLGYDKIQVYKKKYGI